MTKSLVTAAVIIPTAFFLYIFLTYLDVLPRPQNVASWAEAASAVFLLIVGLALVGYAIRLLQRTKSIGAAVLGLYLISLFAAMIVISFASDYRQFGIASTSSCSHVDLTKFDYVYFSVVTWTTLGYGDFVPSSPESRMFAAEEALFGYIFMALYIGYMLNALGAFADFEFSKKPPQQRPVRQA